MLRRVHFAVLGTVLGALACGSGEPEGPVETLSRFLETMDRSNSNESARKEAYGMLDETAQAALAERARRAALVTGRSFSPWEMLAPGRFRLRFAPAEHGGMRATVTGDRAVVRVVAVDGKEHASVPMARQGGRWRVQLDMPAPRRDAQATRNDARRSGELSGARAPHTAAPVARDPESGAPIMAKPVLTKPVPPAPTP
jgi:hypothetical protein